MDYWSLVYARAHELMNQGVDAETAYRQAREEMDGERFELILQRYGRHA